MANKAPYILEETEHFAVVFKPPKMHSEPAGEKTGDTLLDWAAANAPPVFALMHRLDFETHGLILAAKTPLSFEYFKTLQNTDEFIKEYSAVCENNSAVPGNNGFPPPPSLAGLEPSPDRPLVIESFFRPFGPGRKQVRPVINGVKTRKETAGDIYRTQITGISGNVFTARISRGFRHQIRCHLCWAGFPILNDPLYGASPAAGELALRAHALFFTDPLGKPRDYQIEIIR